MEISFLNGSLFYKWKFHFQKENVCPAFSAFPESAGYKGPLVQNNLYAKSHVLRWHILVPSIVKSSKEKRKFVVRERCWL